MSKQRTQEVPQGPQDSQAPHTNARQGQHSGRYKGSAGGNNQYYGRGHRQTPSYGGPRGHSRRQSQPFVDPTQTFVPFRPANPGLPPQFMPPPGNRTVNPVGPQFVAPTASTRPIKIFNPLTHQAVDLSHVPHTQPGPMMPNVGQVPVPMPAPVLPRQPSPEEKKEKEVPVVQKPTSTNNAASEQLRAMIAAKMKAKADNSKQSTPTPAPAPVSEPKPEAKPETKSEAKPEAKPELKSEPKPEGEPEVKPEPKQAADAGEAAPAESVPEEKKGEPKADSAEESKRDVPAPQPKEGSVEQQTEPSQEIKQSSDEQNEEAKIADGDNEAASKEDTKETQDSQAPSSPGKAELPKDTLHDRMERTAADEEAAASEFADRMHNARRIEVGEKVEYPEGVASPSLPEPRHYDISFLQQFAARIPRTNTDLRKIIRVDIRGSRAMSNRGGSRQSSFAGGFGGRGPSRNASMNNMGSMRGSRTGSRRKDRAGSHRHRDDAPAAPVEPLKRGENAWVPRFIAEKEQKPETPAAEEEDDDRLSPEEVQRRVKSLLNKMTMENFDRISHQIIEIVDQSKKEKDARTLRQVIELTFAKAIDEPHWSTMYSRFFLFMHTLPLSDDITDEGTIDKETGEPCGGLKLLRKFLLSRCQQEFERGWAGASSENNQSQVLSDEYYEAVKQKRRGLGLIRFIGELYNLGLVSSRLIQRCVTKLLMEDPTEDVVESLCKLMMTVAGRIVAEGGGAFIKSSLEAMVAWRTRPGFPARLRFMIMDVEDAAKKGWRSKGGEEGPKTLQEIHAETLKQQRQADREAAQARQSMSSRPPRQAPPSRSLRQRTLSPAPKEKEQKPSREPSVEPREETPKEANMFTHLDG